jgi:hypothetical protein
VDSEQEHEVPQFGFHHGGQQMKALMTTTTINFADGTSISQTDKKLGRRKAGSWGRTRKAGKRIANKATRKAGKVNA